MNTCYVLALICFRSKNLLLFDLLTKTKKSLHCLFCILMKNRNVAVVVVVLEETKNLSRSKIYELWRRRGIEESKIFCLELKSYNSLLIRSWISAASFPGSLGTGRREPWERGWNLWRIQGRGPEGPGPPLFLEPPVISRSGWQPPTLIWRSESATVNTVEPPCTTTSRKRPPPINDAQSKTPKLSQSKPYS